MDLSIIIVNWNTKNLLLDCLKSVFTTIHAASFEVLVVDNGSTDGSVAAVAQTYPGAIIISNTRNEGFAKANNLAIKRMAGSYAVLLNSDTLLKPGAIDAMFHFMQTHPDAGICGPQLLNGDGSKQTSFGVFPEVLPELTSGTLARLFSRRLHRQRRTTAGDRVDFIIGACMFVRKAAIEAVGMLDEEYFFFYEEIDWCYRMNKAGWAVYHLSGIELIHFGGRSTKGINLRARVESWRSRYLYFNKTLRLSRLGAGVIVVLGLAQTTVRLLGYTVLNVLTLFLAPRLRRRWMMFAYLMAWHVGGMPVSMCLPR